MIWTVRNLWPSGARFVFNFYRHWSLLVLLNGNCMASFLYIKEGVTQGYPLEMIVYGIRIFPPIKNLKWEIPDITHPWYAGDAGVLGTFTRIETCFYLLTCQGPGRGYYP